MEIEIGRGKKGRRAYGFDDIAIVPSRRTRDPDDIDISWTLGPYRFDLPLVASAMDGVVSPDTAVLVNELGGLGVLNLEGIWTRFEDAEERLEQIAAAPKHVATRLMQEIYAEPVKSELIGKRVEEIKARGAVVCGSLTPQKVREHYEVAVEAGLDILVIQGTVISAEHVSTTVEPLNLKEFIAEVPVPTVVGGCASYSTGLHLMRTGAVGVLVGVGPGAACTTRGVLGIGVPQATAIADVAAARSQHMLETGEYVERDRRRRHAHRWRRLQGDRLRRRLGHGRLAAGAGQRGAGPRLPLGHGDLPSLAAAGHPRLDQAGRDDGGDRARAGPGERRHLQPDGGAENLDGDLRLRGHPFLPTGRGDGRAGADERGQEAAERAVGGHGLEWTSGGVRGGCGIG